MNAIAERPIPARARLVPPERALPATAVEPLLRPQDVAHFAGVHLLQTHCPLFGHLIEAGDVICVDFDVQRIGHDADYLIAFSHAGNRQWFGVRSFLTRPDGRLEVAEPHGQCDIVWRPFSPSLLSSLTVFGMVREVFKPNSKTRFRNG